MTNSLQVTSRREFLNYPIVSLTVYTSTIENSPFAVFLASTYGAFVAGIASLVLSFIAGVQIRQENSKSKNKLLVTVSIAVAIAYTISIGIVSLNIVVYKFIR